MKNLLVFSDDDVSVKPLFKHLGNAVGNIAFYNSISNPVDVYWEDALNTYNVILNGNERLTKPNVIRICTYFPMATVIAALDENKPSPSWMSRFQSVGGRQACWNDPNARWQETLGKRSEEQQFLDRIKHEALQSGMTTMEFYLRLVKTKSCLINDFIQQINTEAYQPYEIFLLGGPLTLEATTLAIKRH